MTAAPLLAALLAGAFPGLAARDLGLPAGRLLPWMSRVRAGVADAAALSATERALLARFRQAGRPLLGFDRITDGMPDAAWDAAAERLVWREVPDVTSNTGFTLLHGGLGEAPLPAGLGRIMLLAGSTAQVERHDLLVPEARLAEVVERLRAAAADLAGPGWQLGGRVVSPRLASLGALAPGSGGFEAAIALPAAGLPHDLPGAVAADGLALGGVARVRLLLGALPARTWRLRLGFAGAEPGQVALFMNGLRQPARMERGGWLTGTITPPASCAVVLGLAWPGGAPDGLRLAMLEARP
jgi:hypothetical protein